MSTNNKKSSAATLNKLELVRHQKRVDKFALEVNRILRIARKAPPHSVMMAFQTSIPGGPGRFAGIGVIFNPNPPPHHITGTLSPIIR